MTADALTQAQNATFLHWLENDANYTNVRALNKTHYAAIMPLMFTHAIITGRIGNKAMYEDRWCYAGYDKAVAALEAWDGIGEPEGWGGAVKRVILTWKSLRLEASAHGNSIYREIVYVFDLADTTFVITPHQ